MPLTKKMYCTVCSSQFHAMRSSAKYCSEGCKQSAKNARKRDNVESRLLRELTNISKQLCKFKDSYFDKKHNPEDLLMLDREIKRMQELLLRMDMFLGTIESEQANTWYQCVGCGQRTFGKVEKCDFCGELEFRIVKV